MTILVTGGTGTLGRLVVPLLREAGTPVRVMSRKPHPASDGVEYMVGDLATGEGVDAAVAGVRTIVHCAGTGRGDGEKAQRLVGAASRVGAPHIVYISVVGVDRVPVRSPLDRAMFGYFGSKLAGERVIAGSGLPWTTLRATQFYDLILIVVRGLSKLPVVPVPGVRSQPVDPADVAERMAQLALAEPAGLVPDIAGPRVYALADLVRSYLQHTGRRRPIVPMPMMGGGARAVRAGAIIAPDRAVGRRTWEDFLQARVPH